MSQAGATLTGTGDLELVISRAEYDAAAAYEKDHSGLLLYINGVALPNDAQLVAVEHFSNGTHLRYRINQGVDTQVLWSSLYRDKNLLGSDDLRAALGWTKLGPGDTFPPALTSKDSKGAPQIAITTEGQVVFAGLVLVVLLVAGYFIATQTDALRDAPLPDWWSEAAEIRNNLPKDAALEAQYLSGKDASYDPAKREQYIETARKAIDGVPPPAGSSKLVSIGLALSELPLRPKRATYSLARVQMALWFTFAVAAGLFLWIIYGQLRRIDGSLLSLLMISVGTTGVSLGVDRNAGGRPYAPSRGPFLDLVTGFDDAQQVHRYQAVVVNLLLLMVGVSHVAQQLTYPIFDGTWLALLGVSGATLGIGKQMLEKPGDGVAVKDAPKDTQKATPQGALG